MKYSLLVLITLLSSCALGTGIYPKVDVHENELRDIVEELSVDIGARNYHHIEALNKASQFIQAQFNAAGLKVELQKYSVRGRKFENVIASIGPENAERIIVGAHYDTYDDQVGADDNASGVAGLLALAKYLKAHEAELDRRIDFVAYTLEEPPFFRSEDMGSFIHAKSLHDEGVKVIGMICLEMIGFFSDEKDSQDYPFGLLRALYPNKGNYIGVISNFSSNSLKASVRKHMSKSGIAVRALVAPKSLVGVDFSDHLNYWKFNYPAVMISDTAFYRNPHYHEASDTIDTLDFKRMSLTVRGIYYAVLNLAVK